jgi:SAM-dependent methyltransferase
MPRLLRTLIPRIRRSIEERGLFRTLLKAPALPIHLFREWNITTNLAKESARSEFDLLYRVDTDGDIGGGRIGRTYLSDLDIPSTNWIYGQYYSPIDPARFSRIMRSLELNFQEFVFVDFGSGKGRALLLASELPFKKIIGIEFSPQLHAIAQSNIRKYSSPSQVCKSLQSICMDFTGFQLPPEPCLLYFLDPCRAAVHLRVLDNIRKSWQNNPREIFIVYISPLSEKVFDSSGFLHKLAKNDEDWFTAYEVSGN